MNGAKFLLSCIKYMLKLETSISNFHVGETASSYQGFNLPESHSQDVHHHVLNQGLRIWLILRLLHYEVHRDIVGASIILLF